MYNVRRSAGEQISAVCERVGSFFCKGTAKPRMRATTAGGDIGSVYLFRVNVKGSGPRTGDAALRLPTPTSEFLGV